MRTGIAFQLSAEDRARLERVAADRNTPQKHVWRVQIVLLSADGVGTMQIMRRTGQSKPTVWRWQERFAIEGVDALLCRSRHSILRTPSEAIEADGADHGPSANRSTVKPGACGAPLRGFGA